MMAVIQEDVPYHIVWHVEGAPELDLKGDLDSATYLC